MARYVDDSSLFINYQFSVNGIATAVFKMGEAMNRESVLVYLPAIIGIWLAYLIVKFMGW